MPQCRSFGTNFGVADFLIPPTSPTSTVSYYLARFQNAQVVERNDYLISISGTHHYLDLERLLGPKMYGL